jgi:hypothetical protein
LPAHTNFVVCTHEDLPDEEAAVSDQDQLIELEIPLVEIPVEPESALPPTPSYYLAAPRPQRRAAPTAITSRDLRAAGLGALVVGVLAALAWVASPPPRLN